MFFHLTSSGYPCMYDHSSYGPIYGNGHDICIYNNSYNSSGSKCYANMYAYNKSTDDHKGIQNNKCLAGEY